MKLNKLLIAILVFIILVSSVYAPKSEGDYDYDSTDSYSDPDFYSNSDPSQWDYSKVDYSQVQDHSKIDSTKYFQDMGCSSCSLNRGNQKVVFSKNGITHPNGNSVSVPGTYSSGSLFVATEARIEVRVPKNTLKIEIPAGDSVTLDTQGREISLSDGTKVNGKLSYKNNQAFVQKGEIVTINNIKIFAAHNNVNIFFDGQEHPKSEFLYVSMNKQTRELILSSTHVKSNNVDSHMVTFTPGNPFVKIEQNDFFSVDYLKGGQIYIKNRDEQDLVPLVIVKEYFTLEDDYPVTATLVNDHFNSNFEKGKFSDLQFLREDAKGKTSTPLSILYIDKNGNNYLKKESELKIIISNYNEMVIIPVDDTHGLTVTSEEYDYAPSIVSEKLYFNNLQTGIEQLKIKFPWLEITGNTDSVSLKRISDTLDSLPEELRKNVRVIHLKTDEQFIQEGEHPLSAAYVDENGEMTLRTSFLKESIIYHESVHTYFSNFDNAAGVSEIKEKYLDTWDIIDELKAQNPKDPQIKKQYQEAKKLYEQFVQKRNEPPLKQEWLSVVGGLEAYDGVVETVDGYTVWKDVKDKNSDDATNAKDGFIKSYSATSIDEDLATFVEKVYTDPDFYNSLITPNNEFYDIKYRQKLDLLYKYNLITTEAYLRIVE